MKKYIKMISIVGTILFMSAQVHAELSDTTKYYIKMILENPNQLNQYSDESKKVTNFLRLIQNVKEPSIVEEAIKRGANMNIKTTEEAIPLHFVAYNYDAVDVLDIILKYTTRNIDTKDFTGITPLTDAIKAGQTPQFIKHLIDAGANVNLVSKIKTPSSSESETPLSIAAKEGRDEIIAVLLENGAKPGPKALKKLEEVDYLDQRIKAHFVDFDFMGVSLQEKQSYLDYFKNNPFRRLHVKYDIDNKPTNPITVHEMPIKEYISHAPICPEDYKIKDAFDETNIWKKYITYASAVVKGKKLPKLKAQYRGDFEIKQGVREVDDKVCLEKLNKKKPNSGDIYYKCKRRLEMDPRYHGKYQLIDDTCTQKAAGSVLKDIFSNEVKETCPKIRENYTYTEFGKKGIVLYLNEDKPIAALIVEDGKTIKSIDGIPYSKIVEEMVKKYGNPNETLQKEKVHHHYFRNVGEWQPVVSVQFPDSYITMESIPSNIRIWFIHEDAKKLLDETLNKDKKIDVKERQREEKEYWEQLKKEYDEKINSFSL